jgi:hypothetical protein
MDAPGFEIFRPDDIFLTWTRQAPQAPGYRGLSRYIDDLEPRLTRHGYTVRALAEQFSVKPAEVRQFLRGELNATRARELAQGMLAAGLPI